MSRNDQVAPAEFDVGAVGGRRAADAPVPGKREAVVLVDEVDHRGFQFVGIDVLRVDPAQSLRGCDPERATRGLVRTKVAAVAGRRPQVARVAGPVFGMFEDIEEVPHLVAIMDWATRQMLSWRLWNTMDVDFCVAALEEALARFGRPGSWSPSQTVGNRRGDG